LNKKVAALFAKPVYANIVK